MFCLELLIVAHFLFQLNRRSTALLSLRLVPFGSRLRKKMAEHEAKHEEEQEQEEEQEVKIEEQEAKKNPKLHAKPKRMLAPENVKRSDIATWDRNDKKTSWQAWKMQTSRILKDSNVLPQRQISFVLGALQGGSASAVLASWGPDGPPSDMAIDIFWATLDSLFSPEESNFHRDNRFKAFKLADFQSISLYLSDRFINLLMF